MSASGGSKAIIAALSANAGIAVAKFVGFAITGSSSMLAEGVHSVADTANQGLLLFGRKRAVRGPPPPSTPSATAATASSTRSSSPCMLFSLGSVFAIYEGVHKLSAPEELTSPVVAIVILVVAILLEGYSFRTAVHESRELKGDASWWGFIRQSVNPELPVVLLEDTGALVGLAFALVGVGADRRHRRPGLGRRRHHRHRHPARRHRGDPHRRDQEPADRGGRPAAAGRHDLVVPRGRAGRAGHPPAHPVPRPGGAARRREDRGVGEPADRGGGRGDRRGRGAPARGGPAGPARLPRAGPRPHRLRRRRRPRARPDTPTRTPRPDPRSPSTPRCPDPDPSRRGAREGGVRRSPWVWSPSPHRRTSDH